MKLPITSLKWQGLIICIIMLATSVYAQNIELVGSCDTPGQAQGIFIAGDLAYIADGESGLQIIDISDKTNPVLVGSYASADKAHGVYVENNFAYIAADHAGLEIVDIGDPADPEFIGGYDTPCNTQNTTVSDGIAYLADIFGGLITVDLSNPSNPELLGRYDEINVLNFVIRDNLAYLAVAAFGINIVDISNPTDISRVGGLYLPPYHTAGAIDLTDNYAYLACGDEGIWTINIADPANPEVVAQTPTQGKAVDICILGNLAYVADADGGLIVFDISDPANPTPVGLYQPEDEALAVEVDSEYIYAAFNEDGLMILSLTESLTSIELEATYEKTEDTPVITFDQLVSSDVGVTEILSPPEYIESNNYPFRAQVTNFGAQAQTFDIVFEVINLDSSTHVIIDTIFDFVLIGNASVELTFVDSIYLSSTNLYKSNVYTILDNDENRTNDCSYNFSMGSDDVGLWYGNLDGSPVTACINGQVQLDLYTMGPVYDGIVYFGLILGANSLYIDNLLISEYNALYYPLTEWDSVYFAEQVNSPPNPDGWISQELTGFAELRPPYDTPFLRSYHPIKIATFVLKVTDDSTLIGQTLDATGPGLSQFGGNSFAVRDACHHPYNLHENFSPLYFKESIEYLPGDVNIFRGAWPPLVIGNDVTYFVNYFRGFENNPPCNLDGFFASADINGDCQVIGSDVTRLISYFRGMVEMSYCPDYPPAWPTSDDLPPIAPPGWPNCEFE